MSNAPRFHTGPNGPGPCRAQSGGRGCPFDPNATGENHYDSMEKAVAAFEDKMANEYGLNVTVEKPEHGWDISEGKELFSYSNSIHGTSVDAKVANIDEDGTATVALDFYAIDEGDSDAVIDDVLSRLDESGYGNDEVNFEITSKYGIDRSEAIYDPEYEDDEPDVKYPLELGGVGKAYGVARRGSDGKWENASE